jgi:hypothetical protein
LKGPTFGRPEPLELPEVVPEVVERELVLPEPVDGPLRGLLVGLGGDLLDERHDVAHPEDPRRGAVGVERLEVGRLLADACELDGLADDGHEGERGTAAGVPVQLRQDDTRQGETVGEGSCREDGVLPRHGVGHEEDLLGIARFADPGNFVHQRVVHVEAPRRVDDGDVPPEELRFLDGRLHARDGIRIPLRVEARKAVLLREGPELLGRRRPVDVGRDEKDLLTQLLLQVERELRRRGRLPRALEADEEDDGRTPLQAQRRRRPAEEADELGLDDLQDLLAGGEGGQHFLPHRLLPDALGKALDDVEMDVRLQEPRSDLLEGFVDVKLRQVPLTPELFHHALQTVGQ